MKQFLRRATVSALANPVSAALLRPLWQGRASIFMLHRLQHPEHAADGSTLEAIDTTIQALRRAGAKLVSVRHLFECASAGRDPEPGCVAFTIDDGYRDQAVLAQQFLKHGCQPTIFLVTGFIDGKLWTWDEQLAYCVARAKVPCLGLPGLATTFDLRSSESRLAAIHALQQHCKALPWGEAEVVLESLWSALGERPPRDPPPGHEPLTWNEIRALEADGVDFGPHSITHRVASQLSDSESHHELTTSWQRLKEELARPLPVYAWPTGRTKDFGVRDTKLARSLDLWGAVATNDGYGGLGSKSSLAPDRLFRVDRFAFAEQAEINVQYGTAIEQLKHRARSLVR